MNSVLKLDLHGVRHDRVRNMLIRFIEDHWDSGESVEIITGHSDKMKEIVEEVLNEYKLEYKRGNFAGNNMGMIRTEI